MAYKFLIDLLNLVSLLFIQRKNDLEFEIQIATTNIVYYHSIISKFTCFS